MDYDVVRSNIITAYKYFGKNEYNFNLSMDRFYAEGSKNPSVAKIMLNDYIFNNQRKAAEILADVAKFPSADIPGYIAPESLALQKKLYSAAADSAINSLNAKDIYEKSSGYDSQDVGVKIGVESQKKFNQEWNRLYPKTGKIREQIINSNRICMSNVTPKADWYEKINYAKTLGEYKKDYPKTFYARYCLIMNNQIEEGQVTPRVKNWFKRFIYKRLIKDGFSFKK